MGLQDIPEGEAMTDKTNTVKVSTEEPAICPYCKSALKRHEYRLKGVLLHWIYVCPKGCIG